VLLAAFITPASLQAKQKVIYLSYHDDRFKDNIPERVFNGEYFSVTVKALATTGNHKKLKYTFKGGRGTRLLNHYPARQYKNSYVLDTFYFLATSSNIVLPNFRASLGSENTTLKGRKIEGVTLNPGKKFSGILANSFKVTRVDAKKYDNKHNIITFEAEA